MTFHHCGAILKAGKHLHTHALTHGKAYAACLQHLGANRCQFQHFFIRNFVQLARLGHDSGICGVNTIHICVDIAPICLNSGSKRHGGCIRATTPQRGYAAIWPHTLKASYNRHHAFGHAAQQTCAIYRIEASLAMQGIRKNGHLPSGKGARGHAKLLQGNGQQATGYLLTRCHNGIVFARIIQRRKRLTEPNQTVGFPCHG